MKRKDDWIEELYIKEYINPLHRSGDSYWQDGKMVMTEEYHIKRGSCCGSRCKHCPFWPQHLKLNKELRSDIYNNDGGPN